MGELLIDVRTLTTHVKIKGWISSMWERADGKHVQDADDGVTSDDCVMMDVFDYIRGALLDTTTVELDFVSQLEEQNG